MRTSARLLGGRYRLGALLGEGAMSTVSCATDELLQRQVAVKMLKPAFASDDEFVARFYREARMAAKIVHSHIIAIYDILSDRQSHAIVMEYAEGPSLADLLRKRGRIEEAEAIAYARQVAQALSAAHAQGLLHRDIKPGNLLLTGDGVLKVADFGLAKVEQTSDLTITQPGQLVGTAAYFSPEQAQGRELTPASDLYSLGIVIHQLVTGEVPFANDSPVLAAVAHVMQPAPTADSLSGSMSPGLARIIARLLQKDPGQRFTSADYLDDAFGAIQGEPVRRGFVLEAPTIAVQKGSIDQRLSTRRPGAAAILHRFWTWSRGLSETVIDPWTRRAAVKMPRRIPAGFTPVAVVMVLLLAGALLSLVRPKVIVPKVNLETISAARARLDAAGLTSSIVARPDERIPQGEVIGTHPVAGATLHKGDRVELVESTGLPVVTLPNLIGQSLAKANRTMLQAKLRPGYAARISDAPANTVIQEIPAPGTRLREHSSALIVISAGPQPQILYSDSGGGD